MKETWGSWICRRWQRYAALTVHNCILFNFTNPSFKRCIIKPTDHCLTVILTWSELSKDKIYLSSCLIPYCSWCHSVMSGLIDLISKLNVTEIQGKWKKIINNQYTGLCVLLLLSKDFFSQSKLLKNKIRLSYSMFQISAVLCLLLSLLMGLIKMWSDLM